MLADSDAIGPAGYAALNQMVSTPARAWQRLRSLCIAVASRMCIANSKMLRELAPRHAQRGEELRFTFETREPFGVERELR